MLTKIGKRLRYAGEKLAASASWLGNKVGGALLSASPVLTAINPAIGAAAVSAGGVLKGVGTLGDLGQNALRAGRIDMGMVGQAKSALSGIRSDAQAIRAAYQGIRMPQSKIERPR
jgi:hypothetical protein